MLLSCGFASSVNADAICNDGWISDSEGSGTCSWHGGVRQLMPENNDSRDNNITDKHFGRPCPLPTSYRKFGYCTGKPTQRMSCESKVKNPKWCLESDSLLGKIKSLFFGD